MDSETSPDNSRLADLAKQRFSQDAEVHRDFRRFVVTLRWGVMEGKQRKFGGAKLASR